MSTRLVLSLAVVFIVVPIRFANGELARNHAAQRQAAALLRFHVTDLGPSISDDDSVCINNGGLIGLTIGTNAYVVRRGHRVRLLSIQELPQASVLAIAEDGTCVGQINTEFTGEGGEHTSAVVWVGTRPNQIPTLPDLSADAAIAINSSNQVLISAGPANLNQNGFLRRFAAAIWYKGELEDIGEAAPVGIDKNGMVAANRAIGGYDSHASLWYHSAWHDIAIPKGRNEISASAINSRGDVAGQCYYEPAGSRDSSRIAMWIIHIGTFRLVGHGQPTCINDRRQIIGYCRGQPALWRSGNVVYLNHCLQGSTGWQVTEVHRINDSGQIVGIGMHRGKQRAVLLTPVRVKPST